MYEWPSFCASSLEFSVVITFYFTLSDRCTVMLHCGFHVHGNHFLMANDAVCFHMCLVAVFHLIVSLFLLSLWVAWKFFRIPSWPICCTFKYIVLYNCVVALCATMYIHDLAYWSWYYTTWMEVWKSYFRLGPTLILNIMSWVSVLSFNH